MIAGKEDLLETILDDTHNGKRHYKEFYDSAGSKAVSEEARELFIRLRDWENSHMHYLAFLYQSSQGAVIQ